MKTRTELKVLAVYVCLCVYEAALLSMGYIECFSIKRGTTIKETYPNKRAKGDGTEATSRPIDVRSTRHKE